ncbi:MAG: TlpA family protein disulfide reductase [Acidiferrobacter sp.]
MKKNSHIAWAVLVLAALGGGYWWGALRGATHAPPPRSLHHAAPRVQFALPNLAGVTRHLDHWPAHVYLINFWAPWCPPCRAEIPLLRAAARRYKTRGLVIIGIALDHAAAVRRFVHDHHIDYPVLLGGNQGLYMLGEFGDLQGAIPFSLLVTRHGRILTGRLGAFTPGGLTRDIRTALKRG